MLVASLVLLSSMIMSRILAFPRQTQFLSKNKPCCHSPTRRFGTFYNARFDCWRPDVQDVERISFGKPAKKKGTGSRGVPHRLNNDERFLFDLARSKGLLVVAGSAWRSQRRDAPLLNTYRSLCDAKGQACIVLHKGNQGVDSLVVDISPLRVPESFQNIAKTCVEQVGMTGTIVSGSEVTLQDDEQIEIINSTDDPWESRPIYQLPPFSIAWELERTEAKELGKILVDLFKTAEGKRAASIKSIGIKPGKSRRHGGYGIG